MDESILDELFPKKPPLVQYKAGPHVTLFCRQAAFGDDDNDGDEDTDEVDTKASTKGQQPIFFQHRDGPILPTLKFIHQFPDLGWTSVRVDKGAISFVLGGAHIMCPGLTNAGGDLGAEPLDKGRGVIVMAEGKENAIAVGTMKLSSQDVKNKNKGVGIETAHFLGDGLFQTDKIY
jgi:PUA domain protein